MNGLDKIIAQILDDAEKEAAKIREEADAQSASVLAEAKKAVKKLEEETDLRKAQQTASMEERTRSTADLQKRQAFLLARQQVISRVLEDAHRSLNELDPAAYFDLIEKMLEKFVLDKDGAIYFSEHDLNRMPEGFPAVIEKTAAKAGGTLELQKEPRPVDGGFILAYGGVEENCSFKALFSARKDELSDKVHEILFS